MKQISLSVVVSMESTKTHCGECRFQHSEVDTCVLFDVHIEPTPPTKGIDAAYEWGHKRCRECAVAEHRTKKNKEPDNGMASCRKPEPETIMVTSKEQYRELTGKRGCVFDEFSGPAVCLVNPASRESTTVDSGLRWSSPGPDPLTTILEQLERDKRDVDAG